MITRKYEINKTNTRNITILTKILNNLKLLTISIDYIDNISIVYGCQKQPLLHCLLHFRYQMQLYNYNYSLFLSTIILVGCPIT